MRPGLMYRVVMGLWGRLDRWLGTSCRTFTRRASDALERNLSVTERLGQAFHRTLCGLCRTQERRLRQLGALARDEGLADAGAPGLTADARERLARALAARSRGDGR